MRNTYAAAMLLGMAVLTLTVSGWLAGQDARRIPKAASQGVPEGVPPGVRFVMVALGGFRGLLADALWVRASSLQDEGSYFEVAQLTEWITTLEPRSPEIWSYHAWNLAYNIGAMFPDPSDRWRWVCNGIHLLRDKGIPANADDPRLYWELGWLYADKVSGRWDPAQLYYRVQLADEMTQLIGGGEFHLESIQASPEKAARLLAVGLQPERLAEADVSYGPLDWRLPETHALYWGMRGRPYQKSDNRWCDRLVWSAMTEMVRGGVLYFDPARKVYLRGPRLDLALKGTRRCESDNVFATPLTAMVGENFLREAMLVLCAFGRRDEASEARDILSRVTEPGGAVQDLDTMVRRDLSARLKGVEPPVVRELVSGMLTSAGKWRQAGRADLESGFTVLARLHWDTFVASLEQGAAAAEQGTWEEMRRQVRGQIPQ